MVYAEDTLPLRLKHIDALIERPELFTNSIPSFRRFLDWLEIAEGKKTVIT
jgi:hypothetical protein